MKQILLIVRKDFLRLRGWLALWVLLLAAKVVIGFVARSADIYFSEKSADDLTELANVLTTVQIIVTYLLALVLVQQDPLMGTQQFWITRPISGGQLLGAKFLGVTSMLVGLPVLISLPWWLTCGFGASEIASAICSIAIVQFAIALPAALVASLTDSLQRAVLWTVVLIAVAAAAGISWKTFVLDRASKPVAWTRTVLSLGTVLLTMISVVALQFFLRRGKIAFPVLAAGVLAAIAMAGFAPPTWRIPYAAREVNPEDASGIEVSLEKPKASMTEMTTESDGDENYLRFRMQVRGVANDRLLVVYDRPLYVWRWSDDVRISRYGRLEGFDQNGWWALRAVMGLPAPVFDPESELQRDAEYEKYREKQIREVEARTAERKKNGDQRNFHEYIPPVIRPKTYQSPIAELGAASPVPASFRERARNDSPVFTTKISLRLWRPDVWFEVPLRSTGWMHPGAYTVRILRVVPDLNRHGDRVTFVVTSPIRFKETWLTLCFPMFGHEEISYEQHYGSVSFANRKLGRLDSETGGGRYVVEINGVRVAWHNHWVSTPRISRDGKWMDWQPDWLDNTTLVMSGYREEARFVREVRTERFEVK